MLCITDKMQHLLDVSAKLAEVNDLDVLLDHILTEARYCVNADSGTLYLRDGDDSLAFGHAQNETLSRRLPPGKKLVYHGFTIPINHESISGYVAATGEVLNIPDVYALSPTVPYHFGRRYDEISGYHTQSMLTVPLRSSRGGLTGVLQLINAQDEAGAIIPFSEEDEGLAQHFANSAALALERAQMTRMLLLRMIGMAELRDPKETGMHVNRVAAYSTEIYERWATTKGMPAAEIERERDLLRMAAMLHDVGKVAISDEILKKPGRFTPEEFAIMQEHTFLGARLFGNSGSIFDDAAIEVALNHHEHWNGRGYPGHVDIFTGEPLPGYATPEGKARGKAGEEIPVFGRVVAIADVYDALISRRCYKDPMAEPEALRIITESNGTQFDPDMVDAFLASLDTLHAIGERYAG